MTRLPMPKYLHEVLGESQSPVEIAVIVLFTLIATSTIFIFFAQTHSNVSHLSSIISFIIIADILAGFVANFTLGTNNYYATRPKQRLIFIAIHIHILVVAWLMKVNLLDAFWVWLFTISSAFLINHLYTHPLQRVIATCFVGMGLMLILSLHFPTWFTLTAVFFMMKVMFNFAIDHYQNTVHSNQ